MYPGRLRPIAVNVFNLMFIGDPVSAQGLAVGRIFGRTYERWVAGGGWGGLSVLCDFCCKPPRFSHLSLTLPKPPYHE